MYLWSEAFNNTQHLKNTVKDLIHIVRASQPYVNRTLQDILLTIEGAPSTNNGTTKDPQDNPRS